MASPCVPDDSELRALQAQCQARGASAAAAKVQELIDCAATLRVQVGFLGERGAGVSTLVRALVGQPRRVTDPWAYFREVPQPTPEPVPHAHPTYPFLTLHDLPGFTAGEDPSSYVARLGDLGGYHGLVLVVGAQGPQGLGETHQHILRAARQKGRPLLLVRTKVDLDQHTAKRRLLSSYNPAEQLGLIRKELTEALAREKMDPKRAFLVSGLETEKYEFTRFEESLEDEVLGLKRTHKASTEDLTPVSQRNVKALYEICQESSLSEIPHIIHGALENPTDIRMDVAVVGEAGCRKSSLITALQGVECQEPGMTKTPAKAKPHLLSAIPQSYLWDLPGGEEVWPLDFSRYNLFLLVDCEGAHGHLAKAITSAGKEAFLVRTKVEEAQDGSGEETEEGAGGTEAPQKDGEGCPQQVFLVPGLPDHPGDLPQLQEALQSGAPRWKRQRLRRAIPAAVSWLVRQKAKVLMREAWDKAVHTWLSCLEDPPLAMAEHLLIVIAGFCQELGLDEASLEHTACVAGKATSVLKAAVQSLFAQPLAADVLLGLISKPPSLGSWAWSYVPYFGRGAKTEAQLSFAATYGTLQRAVVELSLDAERVLLGALMED